MVGPDDDVRISDIGSAADTYSSSIGHVMPGKRAGELLGRIKSAAMAVVDAPQRARRNNAGARGGIRSPRQALTRLVADCTWQKVFGTPDGVLPARPGPRPTKGEEVGRVPHGWMLGSMLRSIVRNFM